MTAFAFGLFSSFLPDLARFRFLNYSKTSPRSSFSFSQLLTRLTSIRFRFLLGIILKFLRFRVFNSFLLGPGPVVTEAQPQVIQSSKVTWPHACFGSGPQNWWAACLPFSAAAVSAVEKGSSSVARLLLAPRLSDTTLLLAQLLLLVPRLTLALLLAPRLSDTPLLLR
jgi:hypothetical protein